MTALEEIPNITHPFDGVPTYIEKLRTVGRRGDIAVLRRIRPDGSWPEVFWRITEKYHIPPSDEIFWATLMPALADSHTERKNRPGAALAAAGVSKRRFEKWCRYDRDTAVAELGRITSQIKEGLDWPQLIRCLYTWSSDDKRKLARDFFSTYTRLNSKEE